MPSEGLATVCLGITDRHRGRVNNIHAERAAVAGSFADSELISRMCRAPDHQARHHSGRG